MIQISRRIWNHNAPLLCTPRDTFSPLPLLIGPALGSKGHVVMALQTGGPQKQSEFQEFHVIDIVDFIAGFTTMMTSREDGIPQLVFEDKNINIERNEFSIAKIVVSVMMVFMVGSLCELHVYIMFMLKA